MSSFSSETPSIYDVQSQRPTTRLRLAMQEHERLMAERSRAGSPCPSQLSMAPPQEKRPQTQATSIADLATQLQTLHQRAQKSTDGEKQAACSLGVRSFIEKIGQQEKDELLVHLLQQLTLAQNERKQVASLGEQMASQLVHQQQELRMRHREQVEHLQTQLHEALHNNPQVAILQQKISELRAQTRESEQRLHFAVQKLQRSRKREKELQMMQDPLWDV